MALPNLLEIAEQYQLDLQLRGNRYWACCPFHEEATPSFSIDTEGRMFKCFGCGKGGGALDFISLWEGTPVAEIKKRYFGTPGRPVRSLGDLQRQLKICESSSEPKRREILSLIYKSTEKVDVAFREWQEGGQKELKRQISTAHYTDNFHHLFTKDQQWEAFWEHVEEQIGTILWHANHGGFKEHQAVALMKLVAAAPN